MHYITHLYTFTIIYTCNIYNVIYNNMHNIYYISIVDDIKFDLSSFQVMVSPHVVRFLRN